MRRVTIARTSRQLKRAFLAVGGGQRTFTDIDDAGQTKHGFDHFHAMLLAGCHQILVTRQIAHIVEFTAIADADGIDHQFTADIERDGVE